MNSSFEIYHPGVNMHKGKIDLCTNKSDIITFLISPSMVFSAVFLKMSKFAAMETTQSFIMLLPLPISWSTGSLVVLILFYFLHFEVKVTFALS